MCNKNRDVSFLNTALITFLLLASTLSAQDQSDKHRSDQWRIAGQNLSNTWSQPTEHSLSPDSVKNLSPKWVFTTGGDVSATPTVGGDAVYFPDWGGSLFAVNKNTGRLIWSHKISEYDGVDGAISRVSPAVDDEQLIIGDILNSNEVHNGANVMAVDRQTGTLRWIKQVESHPAAIITGSPVVFDGVVYIGVSSNEETLAGNPAYPCCSFRGSIVALDAKSGAILWKTFDMPDNGGQTGQYSGGAVWQPPAIDPKRGTLFIGTGNNYTVPAAVEACQNATPTADCAAPDDFFDTALALDLKTGQIKWSKTLQGLDTWTLACILPGAGTNPNCPVPSSPDFDLGGGWTQSHGEHCRLWPEERHLLGA
jgi:polyvinyl alcohol dehydrogenase (cytochrome)